MQSTGACGPAAARHPARPSAARRKARRALSVDAIRRGAGGLAVGTLLAHLRGGAVSGRTALHAARSTRTRAATRARRTRRDRRDARPIHAVITGTRRASIGTDSTRDTELRAVRVGLAHRAARPACSARARSTDASCPRRARGKGGFAGAVHAGRRGAGRGAVRTLLADLRHGTLRSRAALGGLRGAARPGTLVSGKGEVAALSRRRVAGIGSPSLSAADRRNQRSPKYKNSLHRALRRGEVVAYPGYPRESRP